MLYVTLMNIITAINQIESESCAVQIVREPFNISIGGDEFYYIYEASKKSPLIRFAKKLNEEMSIPVILVDQLDDTHDIILRHGFQFRNIFKSQGQSFYIW